MNLSAIAAASTRSVSPPLVGSILTSTGATMRGDAAFTGSVTAGVLTVTALTSGAIAPGVSVLNEVRGLIGAQLSPTTYRTTAPDTPSQALSTTGDGTQVPGYSRTDNVDMDVQPLTKGELQHLDALNIQGIGRSVYIQGDVQGLVRPAGRGGDLLLLPTGLSGQTLDTWAVQVVFETWATGWCKVGCTLQNAPP